MSNRQYPNLSLTNIPHFFHHYRIDKNMLNGLTHPLTQRTKVPFQLNTSSKEIGSSGQSIQKNSPNTH